MSEYNQEVTEVTEAITILDNFLKNRLFTIENFQLIKQFFVSKPDILIKAITPNPSRSTKHLINLMITYDVQCKKYFPNDYGIYIFDEAICYRNSDDENKTVIDYLLLNFHSYTGDNKTCADIIIEQIFEQLLHHVKHYGIYDFELFHKLVENHNISLYYRTKIKTINNTLSTRDAETRQKSRSHKKFWLLDRKNWIAGERATPFLGSPRGRRFAAQTVAKRVVHLSGRRRSRRNGRAAKSGSVRP